MLELKRAKEEISDEVVLNQQRDFRINALKDVLMEKLDQVRALDNEIKLIKAKRQALLEIGDLINQEMSRLLEEWSQGGSNDANDKIA
ncbi:hypothetical protein DCCM_3223 [Desulfocucumis palustris]|uniref:Uncharacterized protein n=1 Tax=Desulfocucumis palustris TaxID=1898651 RepID=A0A2L2XJK8_9FIRM|nr:hypothetical protein [Desulfocucumis palustris]GBF34111.1 hypothetical protein DCCM_3223 [Desulfocucumis palustris]